MGQERRREEREEEKRKVRGSFAPTVVFKLGAYGGRRPAGQYQRPLGGKRRACF